MRARAHVHVLGRTCIRPERAGTFCRRRPRRGWLAGVLPSVGVQREHRRVEHRVGHYVVRGMRRLDQRHAPRLTRSVGV